MTYTKKMRTKPHENNQSIYRGGVCTDVVIPKEFHDKLNYEVIDYDHISAEQDQEKANHEADTINKGE